MNFYYVYKSLAHPGFNNYVQPFTIEERLMHVAEAKRVLGSNIPWLCETMDNELKAALGGVPNAELVVAPDGTIARRRGWSDPVALRKDLEELVGPVAQPTRVEDLDLPDVSPAKTVAKGIVPRIELPSRMRPLLVEPDFKATRLPFYAKLRVEGDADLLESGSGKMYVGFHLDPLYKVHWNNETKPISVTVTAPTGVKVTPAEMVGPDPEEPADADPREFLVDVEGGGSETELELTVRYFACDDAQTFCSPVTQHYGVRLDRDPNGGSVMRGRRRGGRGGAGR